MRIVISSPFAAAPMQARLAALPGVEALVAADKAALLAEIPNCDALAIVMSQFDDAVGQALAVNTRLKWIHFISSGTDPILRWPPAKGVVVTNSADAWAPTVAEHAVALLMALQRRFPDMQSAKAQKAWTQLALRPKLRSLELTRVVILGFGAISQKIAALLKPFGPAVIAVARSARAHPDVERVASVAELDALLPGADAVIAALPLDAATTNLIDARRLALLPEGAVVVNVGRGETIDEAALAEALRGGRLAGAGLDVFQREPLPADSPLWDLDNLILSPHVAGMGRSKLFDRMVETCVAQARRILAAHG